MPFIRGEGDTWIHINMGHQKRRRCRFCTHGWVSKLCDFPTGGGHKTCSAGMCASCATAMGKDLDYCPNHRGQTAPEQGELAL